MKSKMLSFVWILPLLSLVVMIPIFENTSANINTDNKTENKNQCIYYYDNDTKSMVSKECFEECGCHLIAEYNIVVPINETGTIINNIIKNMTNQTN